MRATFTRSPDRKTLIDEWTRLYAQTDARFFQSPAWVETWIDGAPADVVIGSVRVFDDLRGVYALCLVGVPPATSLIAPVEARFQETGVAAYDRVYVEYNDILVARGAPPDAREAAVSALIDALPRVDEFVFRNARPALVLAVDEVAEQRKFAVRSLSLLPTFQIDLRAKGRKSVFGGFSPSLRAKIRRSIRRYEERGPVRLERAGTEADRAISWTELMRLHAQTWSKRGMNGVFAEKSFADFHQRLAERDADAVDLVRLTVGGEAIGALYNFIAGDRVYNYQSGFRYESDNQLAPGFVCHALAADRYREEGFSVYDMMAGEAEYKRRLGVQGEILETIVVTRRGLRAFMHGAAKAVRRLPPVAGKHQT